MAASPGLCAAVGACGEERPEGLAGVAAGEAEADAGRALVDTPADLEQGEPQGLELPPGGPGGDQPAAQGVEQPVGGGVQQEAALVGPATMAAEAVAVAGA